MKQIPVHSPDTKEIALHIAARRKKCGLTQSQVARILNLEKETVSRIENGKISVNMQRLQELADIFHCSALDLFLGECEDVRLQAEQIAAMLQGLPAREREGLILIIRDAVRLLADRVRPEEHTEEHTEDRPGALP